MSTDQVLDYNLVNEDQNKPEIRIVGPNTFLILYVLSFGLYGPWWIYKSWTSFKERLNLDINPAARAIFSVFFLYTLFNDIKEFARERGYNADYSSGLLFGGILILSFVSRLPDPYWMVSFAAAFFYIPAVKALNYALENSEYYSVNSDSGLSKRQIGLVVVGCALWLLIIYGTLADPT